jgi:iron complex transport system permease protein
MKSVRALLLLGTAALAAIAVSTLVGSVALPLGPTLGGDADFAWAREVLFAVRLPRAISAFLVGAALAASGAVLQGVFRNPLADPTVLGVSGCAALAAQAVIFLGIGARATFSVPLAASLGAALGILALLAVLRRSPGLLEPVLLGGVALGQLAVAASAWLLALALRDFTIARRLLYWMLGGLDGRTWMHVLWGLGPVLLGVTWVAYRARELDALLLGETTAASLGVDVARLRRELVVVAALLSGAAVAIGGMIGFVGLVVPHLIRALLGGAHRLLVVGATLGGGLFVVVADLLARSLIAPEELQLGAVTAAVGAPWFLWLLRRRYAELAA